jgi:hypothetical protein
VIRDRGKVKWQHAFAMPEHTKLLKEFRKDYEKRKMPQLDEQELDEIEFIVMDSLHSDLTIKITLWDYGFFLMLLVL